MATTQGPSPRRIATSAVAQGVPLRARRSVDADDRAGRGAGRRAGDGGQCGAASAAGSPDDEQVTVGTGIPRRELVALALGLVDESEHERARRDGR